MRSDWLSRCSPSAAIRRPAVRKYGSVLQGSLCRHATILPQIREGGCPLTNDQIHLVFWNMEALEQLQGVKYC